MKRRVVLVIFFCGVLGILYATTWYPGKQKCPVCGKQNEFMAIGSYGSYIYHWPSKYELIFWPTTETFSVYSCKKCQYTAFMWDFKNIGGDTLKMIKRKVKSLDTGMEKNSNYSLIPMSQKLESAEYFYQLYQTDKEFWCRFYRIMGYHNEKEGNFEQAKIARIKALMLANEMISDSAFVHQKKELLLITTAMKYKTGQYDSARSDVQKALALSSEDPKMDSIQNKNYDEYITSIISDYDRMIEEELDGHE